MEDEIIKIIKEVHAEPMERPLGQQTRLVEDLGFSSLEMLILLNRLEDLAGRPLAVKNFPKDLTVGDVCQIADTISFEKIKKEKDQDEGDVRPDEIDQE